jgi:hypothetical protein
MAVPLAAFTAGCGSDNSTPQPLTYEPAASTDATWDTVDNPQYTAWAGYKPGATAVHRSVTQSGENKTVTTRTYVLRERADDHVAVEMHAVTNRFDGVVLDNPPETFTHARTLKLPPNISKEKFGKPVSADEHGFEVVTVAAGTYKCRKAKLKDRSEAGESLTDTWTSDDVPGRFVKSHTVIPAITQTVRVELIEVKLP